MIPRRLIKIVFKRGFYGIPVKKKKKKKRRFPVQFSRYRTKNICLMRIVRGSNSWYHSSYEAVTIQSFFSNTCSRGTSGSIVEISYDTRAIQELRSFCDSDENRVSGIRNFLYTLGCVQRHSRWIPKPPVEMIGNHLSVTGAGQSVGPPFEDLRSATRSMAPIMVGFFFHMKP